MRETVQQGANRLLGIEEGKWSPKESQVPAFIMGAKWQKDQLGPWEDRAILFAGYCMGKMYGGEGDVSVIMEQFKKEFKIDE